MAPFRALRPNLSTTVAVGLSLTTLLPAAALAEPHSPHRTAQEQRTAAPTEDLKHLTFHLRFSSLPPGAFRKAMQAKTEGDWLELFYNALSPRLRMGVRFLSLELTADGLTARVGFSGPPEEQLMVLGEFAQAVSAPSSRIRPLPLPSAPPEAAKKAESSRPVMSPSPWPDTAPSPQDPPQEQSPILKHNPWLVAGASLVVPGIGQLYLGEKERGSLLLGTSAVLLGASLLGVYMEAPDVTRASGYALLGLSLAAPVDAFLLALRPTASGSADPSHSPQKPPSVTP